MRIGIDVTFLKDQYANRGIGTYGRELIKNLLLQYGIEWVLFGFEDLESNLNLLQLKPRSNVRFVSLGKAVKSNVLNLWRYRFNYEKKILSEKLDLFFAPHLERGLPIGKVKTAVTMHDIIPLNTGKYSAHSGIINTLKGLFYKYNLSRARKADLIITNSEFSKRELVLKGGFEETRIVRSYLGIKDDFRQDKETEETREVRRVLMMYKVPKPYILYYGGLEANKNVPLLFQAFHNVIKRFPDMRLVVVGKEFKLGWDNRVQALTPVAQELIKLSEELKIKHNIAFTGEVEAQHLPVILKNAELFVHLSSYEGFGFAPLEAMASGVATVAARRSCYPEVLQDGAELVNPKETDNVSNAILALLEDGNKKQKLIQKGLKVSSSYSWEKCAQDTLISFKQLLAHRPKYNITYVTSNFHPFKGGAENNCLNLALQEVNNGQKVTVLTSDAPAKADTEEYKGIMIKRFHKYNNSYYLGCYPGIIPAIIKANTDIIHVHGFGFLCQDIGLLLRRFFKPGSVILNTPHGPFMAKKQYPLPQEGLRRIFNFLQRRYLNWLYDAVIAVNPNQTSWIKSYGIDESKIIYIPNGIPAKYLEKISSESAVSNFKLNKKFVISFIGRYEKYKGLQDLISIMPELLKIQKSLKLVAMGNPGTYLPELQKLVADLQLENTVVLSENPDDELIESVLSYSKIFVLPSEWEAFGISMLEAMAKGNAIISTRTEGGEFLIKEEVNGFLYEFGDRNDLTSLISKLLNDRKLLSTISINNINKAKEFTWSEIALKYQDLMYELLKK